MSEANNVKDLKARAVELLRRASWLDTADDLESGAMTTADALRRLREWKCLDSDDRAAIAALEAYINAEWPSATAERSSSTDFARATTTIAELRAHVDALRADIATLTSERDAARTAFDAALAIQSQIWDAVGGYRVGESLVDAVRRVVEERDALRECVEDRSCKVCECLRVVPFDTKKCPGCGVVFAQCEEARSMAKEANVNELGGALSAASEEVAKWPEWKRSDDVKRRRAAFDARVAEMYAQAQARASLADVGDGAVLAAEAERQRALDEAREAGRAEAKAEIDRLQKEVNAHLEGIAHLSKELEKSHRDWADACEAAERRGQEEMRERAAVALDKHARAEWFDDPRELRALDRFVAELRSLPIANAPAAPARTGEANPGGADAGAAGAGESVAREADLATRWKAAAASNRALAQNSADAQVRGYHDGCADTYATCADDVRAWRSAEGAEVARLRRQVERLDNRASNAVSQIERWQEATDCTTPEQAEEEQIDMRLRCANAEETETLVRADRDAAAQEIIRLRSELASVVAAHAAESEAWVKATGASTPDEAAADAHRDGETCEKQRVEIENLRAECARSQWAHEETLKDRIDAEFVVKMWARATGYPTPEDFTIAAREADRERVPASGDIVLHFDDGIEEPAIVRRVRADGGLDLWTTDEQRPFAFGTTRWDGSAATERANNTWRFRD